MIDLSKGIDFQGYLDKCSEEQREKLLKAYEATSLSKETSNEVKNLNTKTNVIVFSEGYCPDCVVTLPFVEKMKEQNENIKVYYYGLQGNKELLEQFTGTARIPTVMSFSEAMEPKGAYIEVPVEIGEKVARVSPDKQKEIILEYRQGKYNDLIEKDLLSIINK